MPKSQSNVETAKHLFATVSAKYPASTVAQGAAIALACQEQDLQPTELGDTLEHDRISLEVLRNAAIQAHSDNPLAAGVILTTTSIAGIVHTDFKIANELKVLPPDELKTLLDRFQYYFEQGGHEPTAVYLAQRLYREEMDRMLTRNKYRR